jgi:hypothetical protein
MPIRAEGVYAGHDKSGRRYLAKAEKAAVATFSTLGIMDAATNELATKPGLPELLSPDDVAAMTEMAQEAIRNLRVFQQRIAAPEPGPLTCALCAEPFWAAAPNARFCSTRCRVAAHRAADARPES